MTKLVCATAALLLAAPLCSAQTVTNGTVAVSGVTGLQVNRQTISTEDADGQLQAGDVGVTAASVGLEVTYYIAPRVGIGALIAYQHLAIEARERDALFDVSGGFFGPLAQVRLPLGERSDFVLAGSFGGISTSLVNRNTGVGQEVDSSINGKYWLAGGALSFRVLPRASFDLGVRYQSSTFSRPDSPNTRTAAAGLIGGIAFTVYLN